jgi:glycosyltransferase involved in cell wall biosynthesis
MDLTANLLQSNSSINECRVSPSSESILLPRTGEKDSEISELRILFEAYPLSLKNGTGIYVYALNLLRGIDAEQDGSVGLLLLMDEQLRWPFAAVNSSSDLNNIQRYAKLLSQLFQIRYPNISRSNRSNSWKNSTLQFFGAALGNSFSPLSFFLQPQAFSFPAVLKSSLSEILNNSFISYDFLPRHHPYLVNDSRSFLVLKTLVGFTNRIKLDQLSESYDVFHCTHLSPLTVKNLPQVTTVHDIVPLIRPELVSNQLVLAFAKLLKYNLRNSTRLIAVSQATKDDLVRYCQVPSEKITVVYEAAREEFKPVSMEMARPILRKIGLYTEKTRIPYFIFVGNIEPKKNVKRLLLAFQQFSMRDRRGCKLLIIGSEAWGFDDVKDLMKEMIAAEILIHPGYLPTHELPALFSHAQALMLPSLIEGFGLPVLEAMACGCPVITSDIPCIREIAGDAAIRVDPLSIEEICQAITAIAHDESLRASLSQLGLAQNKLFSWERCARETLAVYKETISEFAANR